MKMKNNQNGQALFEMILFLPFLVFLYSIFYTAGNSINGSINQQKAVRGYFYNLIKGNSYVNNLSELRTMKSHNLTQVGFSSVGWNEFLEGEISFAPCFGFSSLLKNGTTEECKSNEREEEGSSRFIRLFTFYGVCGAHYSHAQDMVDSKDFFDIDPRRQAQTESCTIGKD